MGLRGSFVTSLFVFFVLLKPNKTVFIEMPAFEYEDQPEYVEIKEDGVDTIVIDDSD